MGDLTQDQRDFVDMLRAKGFGTIANWAERKAADGRDPRDIASLLNYVGRIGSEWCAGRYGKAPQ